jgi:RimJ/RimL family protein N-acetyltransferase
MTKHHVLESLGKLRQFLLVVDRQYLYECPASQALAFDPPVAAGVALIPITLENLSAAMEWPGPKWVTRFRRLLRRGDVGYYVLEGRQIVHYGWVAVRIKGRPYRNLQDPLREGDAMIHRAYGRPDHRRQGLGTLGFALALRHLLTDYEGRHEIRRFLAAIQVENEVPQRLLEAFGWRRTQEYWLIRVLGLLIFRWIRYVQSDGSLGPGRLSVRFKLPDVIWDMLPPARGTPHARPDNHG